MNNVQSGIIGETMRKEHRAREKWVAQYSKQFGMPLSDPGSDDFNTLLPGPTIRMRKPLPFAQAYVPSAYQAIEPGTGTAAGSAGAAAAAAAKEVPAAGATKAQLSGAADAPRHHAPYAYADTAVAHNPSASFGASITRSGLKAAVAHGPIDPASGLFVKGDNTVVARQHAGAHPDMPAAGIKTRPPQQLLTHTKPNAANATGALAPAKNKIGAAVAAQQGAGDADDRVAQPVTLGAAASARGATPKHTESLAAAGAAIANGKSAGAPPSERPPSARPVSANASARLSATGGGGGAGGNGDLSATSLSAYNPALRPASAAVAPSPNLALQKSATLYTALNFAVKDTDQMGVLVYKVDRKSPAEDAGLKKGDLIAYVNNRPTRSVDEFFAVAAHAHGTLYLTIRRRGVAKLVITLKPK